MRTIDKILFWLSCFVICFAFMVLGAEIVYIEKDGITMSHGIVLSVIPIYITQGVYSIRKYIKL